jgi:hypothetical protein
MRTAGSRRACGLSWAQLAWDAERCVARHDSASNYRPARGERRPIKPSGKFDVRNVLALVRRGIDLGLCLICPRLGTH